METYHMDITQITVLNICRLPENSNLLQQLCISQFHLRPAPSPPSTPGLTSGISIFLPWMANSRGWGLLSCQIPRGADEKRGQMPRPPSTMQHFSVIARSSSAISSILMCILMCDFFCSLCNSAILIRTSRRDDTSLWF